MNMKECLKKQKLKVKHWVNQNKEELKVTGLTVGLCTAGGIAFYVAGRSDACKAIGKGMSDLIENGYLQMTLPGKGVIDTDSVRGINNWTDEAIQFIKEHH